MIKAEMETLLRNVDRRTTNIERILPTLATKEELRALEDRMNQKIAPLATRVEVREEGERTRRHFDVVAERLEGQIRLVAESVGTINERMDRQYTELTRKDAELDGRVTRLEAESTDRRGRHQGPSTP